MAEIGPCRELPPSPDAPRWRPSVYFSVDIATVPEETARCRKIRGRERGEYRARAPMAFLDFEIMMLDL